MGRIIKRRVIRKWHDGLNNNIIIHQDFIACPVCGMSKYHKERNIPCRHMNIRAFIDDIEQVSYFRFAKDYFDNSMYFEVKHDG